MVEESQSDSSSRDEHSSTESAIRRQSSVRVAGRETATAREVDRTIDSLFDITEEDVEALEEVRDLTFALGDYAKERPEHKRPFEPGDFYTVANDIEALYQQLAVIVAQKQEQSLSGDDIEPSFIDDEDFDGGER